MVYDIISTIWDYAYSEAKCQANLPSISVSFTGLTSALGRGRLLKMCYVSESMIVHSRVTIS